MKSNGSKTAVSGLVAIFMLAATESSAEEYSEVLPFDQTAVMLDSAELGTSMVGTIGNAYGFAKRAPILATVIGTVETVHHLKMDNKAEALGSFVSTSLGLVTGPEACAYSGAAIGLATKNPYFATGGCLIAGFGATIGSNKIGEFVTHMVRKNNKTSIRKRMANEKFDPSNYIKSRGISEIPGDGVQAQADMERELMKLERQSAIRQGRSYFPNVISENKIERWEHLAEKARNQARRSEPSALQTNTQPSSNDNKSDKDYRAECEKKHPIESFGSYLGGTTLESILPNSSTGTEARIGSNPKLEALKRSMIKTFNDGKAAFNKRIQNAIKKCIEEAKSIPSNDMMGKNIENDTQSVEVSPNILKPSPQRVIEKKATDTKPTLLKPEQKPAATPRTYPNVVRPGYTQERKVIKKPKLWNDIDPEEMKRRREREKKKREKTRLEQEKKHKEWQARQAMRAQEQLEADALWKDVEKRYSPKR